MPKVRLGIIGCGGIALNRHIPGLGLLKAAGIDTFEVTAVCDTVEENVRKAVQGVRRFQDTDPRVYSDWQEMVRTAPIDAVDICLPHGLHHLAGIACLDAGLHVVMEKPYTVTIKTGKALAEAADRNKKVMATAVPHRRMPGERAVHWAINEAGLIGRPRMFLSSYTRPAPPVPPGTTPPPEHDRMRWRRDRAMGGGRGVIDSGFHFFDTIRYLYGDVEQVFAQVMEYKDDEAHLRGSDIVRASENACMIQFVFKSGVVGTWTYSLVQPGHETRNIVHYGSEGSIEDTGYSNKFVAFHQFMSEGELRRGDGTFLSMQELQARMRQALGPERLQQIYPNGVTDHFAVELWDFLDAVIKQRKPEVDAWEGLATLAVVEAAYESAFNGTVVRVDDVMSGKVYGWQKDIDEHWDAQPIPKLERQQVEATR
jgi:UDP-N-acetyl-2-amino-2-deoxyglucuronate dehydrogenase